MNKVEKFIEKVSQFRSINDNFAGDLMIEYLLREGIPENHLIVPEQLIDSLDEILESIQKSLKGDGE